MKVDVIIPWGGDHVRTGELLKGLTRQSYTNFKVILVGDGVKPNVGQFAYWQTLLPITFVYLPPNPTIRYRPSATRNAGALASTCELIAYLDQDCVPDSDWLLTLVSNWRPNTVPYTFRRHVKQDDIFRVISNLKKLKKSGCPLVRWRLTLFQILEIIRKNSVAGFASYSFIVSIRDFLESGGFNEEWDGLWGNDDVEWACRSSRAGLRFVPIFGKGLVSHLDHDAVPRRPECLKQRNDLLSNRLITKQLPPLTRTVKEETT